MSELDLEKLKNELLAENWQGAEKLLGEYFSAGLSEEQKGENLVLLSTLYLEVKNSLHRQHLEILENAIAELAGLDREKRVIDDEIDLKAARDTIAQS